MITKKYKLTTKEVNYLMRHKQSVYVGGYKILWCDQYANNLHHQTGIQVSGKIHKHAVQRNIIRRAFYAAWKDQIDKAIQNHYYKVFIVLHHEHCEEIHNMLTSPNTTEKTNKHQQLTHHFSQIIISSLGKIKHPISKMGSPKPKPYGVSSNSDRK